MSSGFNTDVRVGERVFHVQTEDRGPSHPSIDTAVYHSGRVIHRHSLSYEQFASAVGIDAEDLRQRVENQHRAVIEELRSGGLDAAIATAMEETARAGGIQVQLLNPGSWLSGGNVSLDVEILRRADGQPEPGAEVEAVIEGALQDARHSGRCDDRGRLQLQFPLPPLGKGDLALVIQAQTETGKDEVRFTMRSRPKTPPAEAAQ
ncbi:MAG: hypothetical protein ACRD5M_08465 [Candidatus Acidiferrales bacterium]